MDSTIKFQVQYKDPQKHTGLLFVAIWLLTFVLYLPAAKAGFVSDFTGWLDQVKNYSFYEYINRTHFHSKSLYQLTQFTTYIFYKWFGINPWPWHLLFITLHTINVCLLYRLFRIIFTDTGMVNGKGIAIIGILLFCTCPHISEVIVWEPSFHFLTGLTFILIALRCTQQYLHTSKPKYVWISVIVFLWATHTLEIFYITPWLVLALIGYYALALRWDKQVCRKALLSCFVPLLVIFGLYFVEFHYVYGSDVAHIGAAAVRQSYVSMLGKPAKYVFNILFDGRFFPNPTKQYVYGLLNSRAGIVVFFLVIAIIGALLLFRFRKLDDRGKAITLVLVWLGITVAIMLPLWFQQDFLVTTDRYTYFSAPLMYMLLSLMLYYVYPLARYIILSAYVLINIGLTLQVNNYWKQTDRYINRLLDTIPNDNTRITLLLNLPENLRGVYMISATSEGEYKLMHNLLRPNKPLTGQVYDVVSYNLNNITDGVHVQWQNDSTLCVIQNQWVGDFWWYNSFGAVNYSNQDYSVVIPDAQHYMVQLKKPHNNYMLLYQVNGAWKEVK